LLSGKLLTQPPARQAKFFNLRRFMKSRLKKPAGGGVSSFIDRGNRYSVFAVSSTIRVRDEASHLRGATMRNPFRQPILEATERRSSVSRQLAPLPVVRRLEG